VAIPYGNNTYIFPRLLHSVSDDTLCGSPYILFYNIDGLRPQRQLKRITLLILEKRRSLHSEFFHSIHYSLRHVLATIMEFFSSNTNEFAVKRRFSISRAKPCLKAFITSLNRKSLILIYFLIRTHNHNP